MRFGVNAFHFQTLLLLAVFLSCGNVSAQKSTLDSLESVLKKPLADTARIGVLQKLAIAHLRKNPVKSLDYAEQAKVLSQKTGDRKKVILSMRLMARALRADRKDSLSEVVAERSLVLARELGDLVEISECQVVLNEVYERRNPQKCIAIMEDKIAIDKQLKDPLRISIDYMVLGNKYRLQAKNEFALEYFTIGYETLVKAGMKDKTAGCLQGMAGQNYILGHYSTSVSMLNEAIGLNSRQKEWKALGENYNLMGIVYRRKKPIDSAIYWYQKSIDLFTTRNDVASLTNPLNNLGNIYQDQKQFDKAIEYRRKAIAIYIATDKKNQIGTVLTSLSQTYLDMGQYDRALQTIDSAYNFNKIIGEERETRRLLFQTKTRVYEIQGKLDSSLFYYKKYIVIRDSIYGKESTDKMEKLLLEFETWKKEDQINLLKKDNQIKDQLSARQQLQLQNAALREETSEAEMALLSEKMKLEKTKLIRNQWELQIQKLKAQVSQNKLAWLGQKQKLLEKEKLLNLAKVKESILERDVLIIGTVLLVALGILIFFRIRISNQKARIQTLNRISRDLHDNIGSTLGSITIYSEMAKTLKGSSNGKLEEILGKIEENSRESVDMMGDIVWSLNQDNESLEQLIMRLKNYAADILQTKGFKVYFEIDEKLATYKTSLEQRTNLFLIAKETLFNASKYSEGNLVSVRFSKLARGLRMRVEDDGKGFSDQDLVTSRNGNGIRNMKIRAKEIKAGFTLHSKPGEGTQVVLDLI